MGRDLDPQVSHSQEQFSETKLRHSCINIHSTIATVTIYSIFTNCWLNSYRYNSTDISIGFHLYTIVEFDGFCSPRS